MLGLVGTCRRNLDMDNGGVRELVVALPWPCDGEGGSLARLGHERRDGEAGGHLSEDGHGALSDRVDVPSAVTALMMRALLLVMRWMVPAGGSGEECGGNGSGEGGGDGGGESGGEGGGEGRGEGGGAS